MLYTPADWVLKQFGGPQKTATALGMHRSSTHHWLTRNRGRIPSKVQALILEVAGKMGLDIQAPDLIYGRKVRLRGTRLLQQSSDPRGESSGVGT